MPQLTSVVQLPFDECRREIVSMTSVDNCRLFVLRYPTREQIEVYDRTTFKLQQTLKVAGLSDNVLSGVTACANDNWVIVDDYVQSMIYKVPLSDDEKTLQWRTGLGPTGLSINNAGNLLVTCALAGKLMEYTPKGSFVREINLQLNDAQSGLLHAIQLSGDRFIVCVSRVDDDSLFDDVVEVNSQGRVVVSYKVQLRSTSRHHFKWPAILAVDEPNGCIFVADHYNDRVLMLSRSSKRAHELNASVDGVRLRRPRCVHLDDSLYVGDLVGRIFVFDVRRR